MIFFRPSYEYDADEVEMSLSLRFRIWTSGWRGALVLTLAVVSGLVWCKGRDAYEAVKVRRASRLVAESEAAREKGDFKEASDKLGQATALLRRHPVTLRAVARYQVAMRQLAALNTYNELLKTGEATVEDKLSFVREGLRLGRPELVAAVLEELQGLADIKDKAAVLALKAALSAWNGKWQEAVTFARQACSSPGTDQELAYAQSILGGLLLQPPSSLQGDVVGLLREGVSVLSKLASRGDAIGIEALETLVNLSKNSRAAALFLTREVAGLVEAAERHPQATPSLKVGAWSVRLAAEPDRRPQITRELFEHFKADPNDALRLEAARWLNQRGTHDLAREIVESSKLESDEWFVVYLDAVAASGDWERVFQELTAKGQKNPLPLALRKLFELRVARETGRHPDAADAWRDIQSAARKESAENQLYIAGYAEQIGFPAEAAQIYQRLLDLDNPASMTADKLGRSRRQACYTGALRTGAGAMSLNELCQLVTAFAEEFPEIDEVQNDSAYLRLLSGKDMDKAEQTARRLLIKKPELLAYRTTAALAALRRQNLKESVSLYDGWLIDWSTAQDRYRAVYAAVMQAAGRGVEARMALMGIKTEALRPEERQLVGLP